MLHKTIAACVRKHIAAVLSELGHEWPQGLHIVMEHPALLEHGDYATGAAMQLARTIRNAPVKIAEDIRDRIERDGKAGGLIRKIEVVPPGYLNVFINWGYWTIMPDDVSSDAQKNKPKPKVVIEHTSINPNKSAHIGHLRNSCIGDALARMLKRDGCKVEVHNYIDDLGNQLADTVVGLLHLDDHQEYSRFGDFCWDIYAQVNRMYQEQPDMLQERTRVLHALEEGRSSLAWMGLLAAERIVREHGEEMKQFGIGYDVLVWESSIVKEGFWSAAFRLLSETPQFVRETEGKLAGCWVLKQSGQGAGAGDWVDSGTISELGKPAKVGVNDQDDSGKLAGASFLQDKGGQAGTADQPGAADQAESVKWVGAEAAGGAESGHQADKVLVRSNGILTYTAKDIAYHLWKFGLLERDFTYGKFADGVWTTHRGTARKRFGRADVVLNVIDYRQEYPQLMVKQALEALGYTGQADSLRHVSYGIVSLSAETAAGLGIETSERKSSYAMSGRQGIGIKISDFLDRMEAIIELKRSRGTGLSSRSIAAAAIRYYLLRFSLQTEVVFDIQKATEISGNSGVYLLYAYARAVSVLNKAAEQTVGSPDAHRVTVKRKRNSVDVTRAFDAPSAFPELERSELALLRHLAYWPETLEEATKELAPHMICSYAHELANLFNHFYASSPILKASAAQMKSRIWITEKFRAIMADALEVLGLPAPDRL